MFQKARKIRFISLNINSLLLKIDELFAVTKLAIASASCISEPKLDKSLLNDTHRKKVPSNKTPALTESTNMGCW